MGFVHWVNCTLNYGDWLRGIDGWIRSGSVDETYAQRGEESRHEAGEIDWKLGAQKQKEDLGGSLDLYIHIYKIL